MFGSQKIDIDILVDRFFDYSGPRAHLGRSSAQSDRASAHLPQSAL